MTDANTAATMDRIAKLMAKAKGTDNEHEAALFAAKAAEMLAEHNLTEEMLRSRDSDREQGPIGGYDFTTRCPDRWRELILQGCAKLYYCELIKMNIAGAKYRLYGREHNYIVAKLMAEYLFATVKRMAREYSPGKVEQSDFRRGAGLRLYERLLELHKAQLGPVSPSNPGNLPALINHEIIAVDDYIASALGKLRTSKAKPMKMGFGAMAGRSAADKIGLNTQVKETRASRMIGSN